MSHEDHRSETDALWEIIYLLEERIVELEMQLHKRKKFNHSDSYYWEHG